jgi:hypothetical protein
MYNHGLAGFVYCDDNANGVKDAGDEPLAGIHVTLTGTDINGQAVNQTTTTDGNGAYIFLKLPGGTYKLTESAPSGTTDKTANIGSLYGGSAVAAPGKISNIVIVGTDANFGKTGFGFNFAEICPPCPDLGAAGNFAALGLANTRIELSSGALSVKGNVGVSKGDSFNFSGGGHVIGQIDKDSPASFTVSGGSTASGGIVNESLATAQADALAAATVAASLAPTRSFAKIGNGVTITGNGGQNVIAVAGDVQLSGGSKLTLVGGANDSFIFNIKGTMNLSGGSSIVLTGGLTSNHVLFNFIGGGQEVVFSGNSRTAGTFIAPKRDLNVSGGFHDGEFISGTRLLLHSGPTIVKDSFVCPDDQTTPVKAGIKISAGGPASGSFVADTDFVGGFTASFASSINTGGVTNPAPQSVYQHERFGAFTYKVGGLTPGAVYVLRLDFCENAKTAAGQRVFDVDVNGDRLLENFDVFAAVGGAHKALAETLGAKADANGNITIDFYGALPGMNAQVNGIEVSAL